tara:strand:- start:153 stop:347 length:195 start_codon:yes stop_codon:yes gene_type:complete
MTDELPQQKRMRLRKEKLKEILDDSKSWQEVERRYNEVYFFSHTESLLQKDLDQAKKIWGMRFR